MNTRIAYKARPKDKDHEGTKQAKRRRLYHADSAHKVGPGKRNIILEHNRIRKNIVRNIERANAGKHLW